MDIVVMIFVLSALHPKEWMNAVANVYKVRDFGEKRLVWLIVPDAQTGWKVVDARLWTV